MLHTRVVTHGLVLLALGTSSQLFAEAPEPPAACQNARDARAYLAGQAIGASWVHDIWNGIDDCDRLDVLYEVILATVEQLTIPASPTSYILCRYGGTIDGIFSGLDAVGAVCAYGCMLDPAFVGEIGAVAACELVPAVGGLTDPGGLLNGPPYLCASFWGAVCQETFAQAVTQRCPLSAKSGVTDPIRDRVCYPSPIDFPYCATQE